jgi:hypothetical protein
MFMFRSNTLILVMVSMLTVSSVAVAATTGSVTLGGTVSSTLTVTSVPTAAASTLDLTPGEKIVQVSDISMSTNNEQGLTLSATSGNLTKTGGTTITFQVTSVPDGDSAPATGDFAIATGSAYEVGTLVAGSDAVDLYIKYTPAALQDPGAYGGSIGLTVTDN